MSVQRAVRWLGLKGLDCMSHVGVHPHEKGAARKVAVDLDMCVVDTPHEDRIARVVNYEDVAKRVRDAVAGEHVNLIETLAERIAAACLEDKNILSVRVRIEKPQALGGLEAAAIEIERRQQK